MADFFWYFFLYSFVGFLFEVVYARATHSPKQDRKCLYLLPLCPVYGLGAVLILLLPPAVRDNPLLLLPAAAVLCTAAEYLMGLFYEKAARVPFWDYSHLPHNLGGRVCLRFTLLWGVLAVAVAFLLHPFVAQLVPQIPRAITLFAALLFLLDALLSLTLLRRTRSAEVLRWYAHLRRPAHTRRTEL